MQPEGAEKGQSWGWREAIIGLGLVIFAAASAGTVVSALTSGEEESSSTLALGVVTTLVFELSLVSVSLYLVRQEDNSFRALGLQSFVIRPGVVLAGLLACYAALYSYSAVVWLLGLDGLLPGNRLSSQLFDYPWLVALVGFTVVVTAPITEEIFFRGFLFRGLARDIGFVAGAVVSGLIFSSAHISLGAILPFTAIGAIFALSYRQTGSLYTPIVMHMIFNLVSFSVLLLVPEARNQ